MPKLHTSDAWNNNASCSIICGWRRTGLYVCVVYAYTAVGARVDALVEQNQEKDTPSPVLVGRSHHCLRACRAEAVLEEGLWCGPPHGDDAAAADVLVCLLVRPADERPLAVARAGCVARHSKVGDAALAVRVDEDVAGGEVAVDDVVCREVSPARAQKSGVIFLVGFSPDYVSSSTRTPYGGASYV